MIRILRTTFCYKAFRELLSLDVGCQPLCLGECHWRFLDGVTVQTRAVTVSVGNNRCEVYDVEVVTRS